MSHDNETTWPDPEKHFYIVSKINNSNYALTANGSGGVATKPFAGTIDQVWRAQRDDRGGAFLQHVNSGLYLAGNRSSKALNLAALDTHTPDQLWRVEKLGDNWVGINSTGDWEMKINVYGSDLNGRIGLYHWDGGADNEKWLIREEAGQVTVDSIEYDRAHGAADLVGVPPSHCTAIFIDNTGGTTPLVNTYALTRSVTTQRSFTRSESETTGTKYTQTYSVKGSIEKVYEVSMSGSIEESQSRTTSWSEQSTDSKTDTDSITTQVNVPPGKKYSYHVIVYYGKVTIPYTAHMTFRSSTVGIAPVQFTSQGMFTGVNSTRSEIVVKDVTAPQDDLHVEVERRPIVNAQAA